VDGVLKQMEDEGVGVCCRWRSGFEGEGGGRWEFWRLQMV